MRRMLALAGLFLLLTGCGGADERAPFVESRIPPALGPGYWAPDGWAWGLLGLGEAPVQRYGVSSSATAPRGNILILADDGQTAEVWFETARDLNARGFTVWVLERSGQGGSARYAGSRELIHAPSFDDDVATVRLLARTIVVEDRETPLTIVGQGVGGLVGLRAVQERAPAAVLVLSAPDLGDTNGPALPGWLLKAGIGRLPSGLETGWKREAPAFDAGIGLDRSRNAVQQAWQIANPDLRMGGHSLGWNSAYASSLKAAREGARGTTLRTIVLGGNKPALDLCGSMPACVGEGIDPAPGQPALTTDYVMAADAIRSWWLDEVACAAPAHPRVPAPQAEQEKCAARDRVSPALSGHQL